MSCATSWPATILTSVERVDHLARRAYRRAVDHHVGAGSRFAGVVAVRVHREGVLEGVCRHRWRGSPCRCLGLAGGVDHVAVNLLPVGAAALRRCCASAGKRANASRPSQSEMLRFMFFSLGAAGTMLPASSKNHSCLRPLSVLAQMADSDPLPCDPARPPEQWYPIAFFVAEAGVDAATGRALNWNTASPQGSNS